MLARFEADSNAAVDSVPAGISRSKIFRILNLALIALALSGCAIPLRESDGPSKSAGSADWISEFPIVSRSREANDRTIADALCRFFGRLTCNGR
jgi:hypothetical protein